MYVTRFGRITYSTHVDYKYRPDCLENMSYYQFVRFCHKEPISSTSDSQFLFRPDHPQSKSHQCGLREAPVIPNVAYTLPNRESEDLVIRRKYQFAVFLLFRPWRCWQTDFFLDDFDDKAYYEEHMHPLDRYFFKNLQNLSVSKQEAAKNNAESIELTSFQKSYRRHLNKISDPSTVSDDETDSEQQRDPVVVDDTGFDDINYVNFFDFHELNDSIDRPGPYDHIDVDTLSASDANDLSKKIASMDTATAPIKQWIDNARHTPQSNSTTANQQTQINASGEPLYLPDVLSSTNTYDTWTRTMTDYTATYLEQTSKPAAVSTLSNDTDPFSSPLADPQQARVHLFKSIPDSALIGQNASMEQVARILDRLPPADCPFTPLLASFQLNPEQSLAVRLVAYRLLREMSLDPSQHALNEHNVNGRGVLFLSHLSCINRFQVELCQ